MFEESDEDEANISINQSLYFSRPPETLGSSITGSGLISGLHPLPRSLHSRETPTHPDPFPPRTSPNPGPFLRPHDISTSISTRPHPETIWAGVPSSSRGPSGPSGRTPRTLMAQSVSSNYTANVEDSTFQSSNIVAILEGRGGARGEVGMAMISLSQPTLILCQFSDSRTYTRTLTKLKLFQPMEVLISITGSVEPTQSSKLNQEIADWCPKAGITPLQRRYFSETNGLRVVRELCAPEYATVELQIKDKYYSLAAASALIQFVEHSQNTVYAPKSLRIEFQACANTTLIDAGTIKHMELLTPLMNSKLNLTLFGLLHKCCTPAGIRYLRANLFQPPAQLELIRGRLDAVEELVTSPGLFRSLQSVVSRFCDIDQLLSLCVAVPRTETLTTFEHRLNHVIGLKHALELVEPLHSVLEGAECSLLSGVCQSLEDPRFEIIVSKVSEVIHDHAKVQRGAAAMKLQRCFAIRNGVHGLLDVARRTYCEIVDDIEKLVGAIAEEYDLPLRVGFNAARGYHVQLPVGGRKHQPMGLGYLPKSFLRPQKTRNMITFTTEAIIQADQRSQESLREIVVMSNAIIQAVLGEIRDSIGSLYKLSESVCSLDLILALTEVSLKDGYVRPQFGESTVIRQGRHPILESIKTSQVIANDTTATSESSFHVLTGANMSGKSTYLRQIVLLQIMAQMGAFVPADFASFRIADVIMSRIGTGDSIESNASTFMLEMREMAYILSTVGSTSLIVMDELGRGTSSNEGASICWSISEELVQSKAFCFLATHFCLMTRLESMYCKAVSHHFLTEDRIDAHGEVIGLSYTYKMGRGTALVDNYGIRLTKSSASMPKSVVQRAEQIAGELALARKAVPEPGEEEIRQMNALKLVHRLVLIGQSETLSPEVKLAHLKGLQEQFKDPEEDDEELEDAYMTDPEEQSSQMTC